MKCQRAGFVKRQGSRAQVLRFRCNCWKCQHCSPNLRTRLIATAKAGRPNKLLTLTVNPAAFKNPDEAARALTLAWRRCRQQLKRHHKHREIAFLAVFEQHKSGWPHLHILLRCGFIPQKWLSQYFGRRIDSPIVDIRKIGSKRDAAKYVAKYVAKQPERYAGSKRHWRSPGYAPKRQKPPRNPNVYYQLLTDAEAWLKYFYPAVAETFAEKTVSAVFTLGAMHQARPPPKKN